MPYSRHLKVITKESLEAFRSEVGWREYRKYMKKNVGPMLALSLIHISEPTRPY